MPSLPEHDTTLMPRLSFLLRVESLINVGCKYGPNDLEPQTWDQLLILASERQFVERLLDRRRDKKGREDAAVRAARAKGGIPQAGGTLFHHSKPFR